MWQTDQEKDIIQALTQLQTKRDHIDVKYQDSIARLRQCNIQDLHVCESTKQFYREMRTLKVALEREVESFDGLVTYSNELVRSTRKQIVDYVMQVEAEIDYVMKKIEGRVVRQWA